MKILFDFIILFLVGVSIFFIWRKVRAHHFKLQQSKYEFLVTQAVKSTLKKVRVATFDGANVLFDQVTITPVAQAWGLDVVVFGYSFSVTTLSKEQVHEIKNSISQQLAEFSDQHALSSSSGQAALVVSDIWWRAGVLNLEVAYLINDKTRGYVRDVKKLDH